MIPDCRALSCLALPVQAQDAPPAGEGLLSLMERAACAISSQRQEAAFREFERGLTEIEPELIESA